MTRKAKVTWAEKAFQYPNELWRVRTGGYLTHISGSEALWLTLELAPEKMDLITGGNHV